VRLRQRYHIQACRFAELGFLSISLLSRHPDKGDYQAAAIPGEFGILPVPRGLALFAMSGFESHSFHQGNEFSLFARLETEKPRFIQHLLGRIQPAGLDQSFSHDPNHVNIAGCSAGGSDQFTNAALDPVATHGCSAKSSSERLIPRVQPARLAEPDRRLTIAPIRISLESEPTDVKRPRVCRFQCRGRTQMAPGLTELVRISKQFCSQPVCFASNRGWQVRTGKQAAKPEVGVHPLAMCGQGSDGIPTSTDQSERPAHDQLPSCSGLKSVTNIRSWVKIYQGERLPQVRNRVPFKFRKILKSRD
jgi:hypothetical protein